MFGESFTPTRVLREGGIYTLSDLELIAKKGTDGLYFLFTWKNWHRLGPVDYRLSHGRIFQRGQMTGWTGADLVDTGRTAGPPMFSLRY